MKLGNISPPDYSPFSNSFDYFNHYISIWTLNSAHQFLKKSLRGFEMINVRSEILTESSNPWRWYIALCRSSVISLGVFWSCQCRFCISFVRFISKYCTYGPKQFMNTCIIYSVPLIYLYVNKILSRLL